MAIHHLKPHAVAPAERRGHLQILFGGAVPFVRSVVLGSDADVETVGAYALLRQQMQRHGTIHAARKQQCNTFLVEIFSFHAAKIRIKMKIWDKNG